MKFIKSKNIYTEKGWIDGVIGIEDKKIACIIEGNVNQDVVDYGDLRIIPGIIDTHNHGACGYGFDNDQPVEDFHDCLKGEAANGVTGVFATIHTLGHYGLIANLAEEEDVYGARVLGIHSEGPWGTRVGEKGDPNNTYYLPVSIEHGQKMIDESRGWLRTVSLAPEKEGCLDAIKYLVDKGVICSAYHTNATYEECKAGIEAGIRNGTHLANVMTGLHHRNFGTFGALLEDDRVWTEQICDGLHVCNPMLKLIFKVKPHEKIMLVSDNGAYLGAPVGTYKGSDENTNNDRKLIHVNEDGFVLSDSGRLSGSSKPVLYGIGNLVNNIGLTIEDAITMSSYNVAKRYGLEGRGSIAVGNYADFVVITDDYKAQATFVDGKQVWDAATEKMPFNPTFIAQHKVD